MLESQEQGTSLYMSVVWNENRYGFCRVVSSAARFV